MSPSGVSVAGWMQPWWDFWAGITQTLYWPAWAAIFTFLALLNTARIADRTHREERRRRALVTEHAATVVDGVTVPLRRVQAHLAGGHNAQTMAKAALDAFSDTSPKELLAAIDSKEFGTAEALQALMIARLAYGSAELVCRKVAEKGPEGVSKLDLEELGRQIDHLNNCVVTLHRQSRAAVGRSIRDMDFSHFSPGMIELDRDA